MIVCCKVCNRHWFRCICPNNYICTWVILPYLEVWKSCYWTANLGSLNQTFFLSDLNWQPWQFHGRILALGSKSADLGTLTNYFQHIRSFGSQMADLGSFMAAFQLLSKVAMKLPTLAVLWPLILPKIKWPKNGWPWQFHDEFLVYLYLFI